MAWIGNYFYNTLFGTDAIDDIDGYKPSIRDVLAVKEALHKKSTLPYELVDAIVDMAEYWPHTSTFTSHPITIQAGRGDEDKFIVSLSSISFRLSIVNTKTRTDGEQLRSYPLGYIPPTNDSQGEDMFLKDTETYQTLKPKPCPESRHVPDEMTEEVFSKWSSRFLTKGKHACRKIVFTIKSHDQGWGGRAGQKGTYEGSYTWFEAGLERMTACRRGKFELPSNLFPLCTSRENIESSTASIANNLNVAPNLQFEIIEVQPNSLTSFPASSEPLICNLRTALPSIAAKRDDRTPDRFHHGVLPSTKLTIQKNVVASRAAKEHKVTWMSTDNVVPDSIDGDEVEKLGRGRDSANGDFVRNLKVGDVVTVWGKARFAGWANFVDEVKIDVYWAI
jgi:hypothetical protein